MPFLHTISLQGLAGPYQFAQWVLLPFLQTLRCDTPMSSFDIQVDQSATIGLVRLYGPQLTSLTLDYSMMSRRTLESCLASLQSLRELRLVSKSLPIGVGRPSFQGSGASWNEEDDMATAPPFGWGLLRKLAPSPEAKGSIYCPKLEVFCCRPMMWEFDDVDLAFLAARLGSKPNDNELEIAHLRCVMVKFGFEKDIDVKEKLHEMGVDLEGLQLSVTYPPVEDLSMYHPSSYVFPRVETIGADFNFL